MGSTEKTQKTVELGSELERLAFYLSQQPGAR